MKKIRFTALCLALVLSAGLLAGCGNPAENSFDAVTTNNSSIHIDIDMDMDMDSSTTVESPAASSADESEESTESSPPADESDPEETSESADSATSRPDDESEAAEEPSAPSEQSKPETSKTETSSSEPSKETSKDDETSTDDTTGNKNESSEQPNDTCSHTEPWSEFFPSKPTDTKRGELQYHCGICGAPVTKTLYSNEEYAEMIRPYLLKYINQYRKEAGLHEVKLTQRRTEYSQYRAWQLTKNFSHAGMGEAAEATHCGYYASDKWYDGEFFEGGWEGFTTEICTSTDSQKWGKNMIIDECDATTLDTFAKHIIDNFYNSTLGHKQIMLSDHDYYVGIGYYNGKVCINFDFHNSDEINYFYDWQDENGKTHLKNIRDHKDENGNWIIDWEWQEL